MHAWNLLYQDAFESFFGNEGARIPEGIRLRRTALQALSERAYWGAIASMIRGDLRLSADLLRFAITRRPSTMIVPPVGYLLRRADTLPHVTHLLWDALSKLGRNNHQSAERSGVPPLSNG